jgi:hypothetical protein
MLLSLSMPNLSPTDVIPSAVADVGTFLVVCLLLAQAPLYYTAIRKGSLAHVTYVPLQVMWLNFFVWTVYGTVTRDPHVLYTNIVGCVFVLIYSALQILYNVGAARARLLRDLLLTASASIAVELVLFFSLNGDSRKLVLGITGASCNVVMFLGPLVALRTAVITLDDSALPVLLILVHNVVSVVWGAYGFLVGNIFILLPNAIAVVINVSQLFAVIYIRIMKPPRSNDVTEAHDYALIDSSVAINE